MRLLTGRAGLSPDFDASVQRAKLGPNGPVTHPSIWYALASRGAPKKLGGGRTFRSWRGHL